jgi:hypothetical protein
VKFDAYSMSLNGLSAMRYGDASAYGDAYGEGIDIFGIGTIIGGVSNVVSSIIGGNAARDAAASQAQAAITQANSAAQITKLQSQAMTADEAAKLRQTTLIVVGGGLALVGVLVISRLLRAP